MGSEVAQRNSEVHSPLAVSSAYAPNVVRTVADYLAKPIPVTSGSWTTAQASNAELLSTDTWDLVYNQPMWREKLRGFYGLRSSLHVRLVLNGTPFHAGMLRMFYYPAATANSNKWPMHVGHRMASSQLPGVEIRASDTSCELVIPYVTQQRFIELTSVIFSWGRLFIRVYSPLAVGSSGSNNITWTLWMWHSDVELFGQTSEPINAQMSLSKKAPRSKKLRPPTEQEKTPISSILADGASVVGKLAAIPTLAPYVGPTAWALNAMSGVAAAFGWSKPLEDNESMRMSSNYNWNIVNATGVDNSIPLSLYGDNKLSVIDDPTPGGEDEMSVDFIKSRWAFVSATNWSTSSPTDTQLMRRFTDPRSFEDSVSSNELYLTPIAFLGNLFTLYRGGIDICLKFVKTAFHSGSLALTFVPGPSPSTLSLANSAYCYRTIFDLQQGDEVCVRLPYLLPLDFINTDIRFGSLYITVVNPLRAPETVSSNIQFLLYVRGAPEMEFSIPDGPNRVPIRPQFELIVPQGGETEVSGDIICQNIGDGADLDSTVMFHEHASGEMVRSVLPLLKRYTEVNFPVSTTNEVMIIYPFFFNCVSIAEGSIVKPSFRHSYFSYILGCYAFYRGGIRYRLLPVCNASSLNVERISLWAKYVTKDFPGQAVTYSSVLGSAPSPIISDQDSLSLGHSLTIQGGLSVQIPYQGPYRMSPMYLYTRDDEVVAFDAPRGRLKTLGPAVFKTPLLRAVADDFQALFWVGVPRMSSAWS